MARVASKSLRRISGKIMQFQRVSPLLIALALGGPVFAQSVEIGDYVATEVSPEDIEAAESELFRRSLQGFGGSLADLGRALVRGDGMDQDVTLGINLLEAAAAQGSVPALYHLGDFFSRGEFVPVDAPRAFDAYDRAVSAGDDAAYLRIGRMFEGRDGVPADPDRAIAAYDEAVWLEVEGASAALARGHLTGRFLELSDPALALEMFEQGDELTRQILQRDVGEALLNGEGVDQDVERGLRFLTAAGEAGNPWAWIEIGDAYAAGDPLPLDADKALEAYQKAVQLKQPSAYFQIAQLYEAEGPLADQPARAIEAYQSAAAAGLSEDADVQMARGHLNGDFQDLSDPEIGYDIFKRLQAVGNPRAADLGRAVGEALVRGDGLAKDAEAGIAAIQITCDSGSPWACISIGRFLNDGVHMPADGRRALKAYETAVELGGTAAHLRIARLFEEGSLLPADPQRALAEYQAAAAAGMQQQADFAVAKSHLRNKFGALSDAQAALEIFQTYVAAENPQVYAALGRDIGEALFSGERLEQDIEGGLAAIKAAAETGSGWAWIAYGKKFADGTVIDVDQAQALSAYEQALALGRNEAHFNIGRLFEDNQANQLPGLKPDPERAFAAYQAAADAGLTDQAELSMARAHVAGRFGSLSDRAQGRALYETLLERGSVDAKIELARELVSGERLSADPETGLTMLEAVALEGNDRAEQALLSAIIRGRTPRTRIRFQEILDQNDVESDLSIYEFTRALAAGRVNYSTAWDVFLTLPEDQREIIARAAAGADRSLYVGLLQGALTERGVDVGPVDGLLGRRTTGGYRAVCNEEFDTANCRRFPWDQRVRDTVATFIASTEKVAVN